MSLDTNVFVFALRKDTTYPACEILLFDKLSELQIYIPLQIFVELQRILPAMKCEGSYALFSEPRLSCGIMRQLRWNS